MTPVSSILQGHPDWPATLAVLEQLRRAGHRALLAGGCVRDALLGQVAQDLDIATSATPYEVISLFPKTVEVGKSFGVVRVLYEGADFEVATFREDGPSLDGRRPESVSFSDERSDAQRRDFTVNALFYDPLTDEVLDHVGGIADLSRRSLRTVGEAARRFEEDHLRILRAVRFAVQLDFEIEAETWECVKKMAPLVAKVSAERVRDELWKLLRWGRGKRAWMLLESSGLWKVIFPELPILESDSLLRLHQHLARVPADKVEAFSSLFVEWDPGAFSKTTLKKLRLSRAEEKAILTRWKLGYDASSYWKQRSGAQLELYADPHVQGGLDLWEARYGHEPRRDELRAKWKLLSDQGGLPQAFLTGDDVKEALQGAEIRDLLKDAYHRQLEGEFANRDAALTWFSEWLKLRRQQERT